MAYNRLRGETRFLALAVCDISKKRRKCRSWTPASSGKLETQNPQIAEMGRNELKKWCLVEGLPHQPDEQKTRSYCDAEESEVFSWSSNTREKTPLPPCLNICHRFSATSELPSRNVFQQQVRQRYMVDQDVSFRWCGVGADLCCVCFLA